MKHKAHGTQQPPRHIINIGEGAVPRNEVIRSYSQLISISLTDLKAERYHTVIQKIQNSLHQPGTSIDFAARIADMRKILYL